RDRPLELPNGVDRLASIEKVPPLQVVVVRLDILGRALRQTSLVDRKQPYFQRLGDGARDLVLNGENILHLAIVAVRPQVVTILDVDQLRRHADLAAGLPDAAFQNGSYSQRRADLPNVLVLPLERERGGPGRDAKHLDLRQRVDDLFSHAVAEVIILSVGAHVAKRKNGDGPLRDGTRAGYRRPVSAGSPGRFSQTPFPLDHAQRESQVARGLKPIRRVLFQAVRE